MAWYKTTPLRIGSSYRTPGVKPVNIRFVYSSNSRPERALYKERPGFAGPNWSTRQIMKVLGWIFLILLGFALIFMLGNFGDGSSVPEQSTPPVPPPSDSPPPTPSTNDSEKPETNTALRTDDREETAQLATDNVEKEQAEENSQIDYSVLDIPEQDVDLAFGAVKIINSDNIQWVACPFVDEMHYLTNFYEELRTTHERDELNALADNASSHFFDEKRCTRVAEDLVLVFTDTPSQTSSYLDSNVSFIQVTVYRITGDDGDTENLGNYWIVQEFVANSQISSPVRVRRTQSTQEDTPASQPPAEKPKGKIVTVTGDYLIVCSDLPGLRTITNIDLADYPEGVIPQILDNTRCRFLYQGDQLRLDPEAATEGDFVKLPIIEGDADEYEMWTSTGLLMIYTDVIGVR